MRNMLELRDFREINFPDLFSTNPVIQLANGAIFGKLEVSGSNKHYYSFQKIPYAVPPIGKLRFRAPQPPDNWNHILNCTFLDVICYQISPNDIRQSEDCLYLNVFTSTLPKKDTNVSLPVMVYIHGGGFVDGSSKPYTPDLLIDKDVLLVTINYRLGPLGFLSTQDVRIPGNNGLKDQNMALRWVQNNIKLFGGDPKRVTLFGHSAGSASIGYHLLNPKSGGLFWAAICQSGSVLGPWAYQRNPRRGAFKLASFLNETFKSGTNSEELLRFLQYVSAEDIYKAAKLYNKYVYNGSSEDFVSLEGADWVPTIEPDFAGAIISKKMFGLLERGEFLRVPILMGFVTEENLNFHTDQSEMKSTMKNYDKDVTNLVPVDMEITNISQKIEIGNRIKKMYTGGAPFADNLGDGLRFSSDNDMTRPIMKQAELISKFAETYFYVFSYDGLLGHYCDSYEGAGRVGHGAELFYLFCFRFPCFSNFYPKSDNVTRERLLKIWTDFAKFRYPTTLSSSLLQNISWPLLSVDNETFAYVEIGTNLEIKNFPKEETYKKWNKLYASLGLRDFDTW